jgi:RNA polymerase sigma factor (sigma-70 family)
MDNTLVKKARKGDSKAVSTLLNENINYIYWIAHKLSISNINFEDLVSEGKIGFLKALGNYDPENTSEFLAYAYPYIRGEILKYMSNNTFCVHLPDYKIRSYMRLKRQSKSPEKFKKFKSESLLSLDEIKDLHVKSEFNCFENIENRVFLNQLFCYCKLSKLEIFILRKFYGDQMQLKEISTLLNLEKSQVSKIKKNSLRKLRFAVFSQDDEKICVADGR